MIKIKFCRSQVVIRNYNCVYLILNVHFFSVYWILDELPKTLLELVAGHFEQSPCEFWTNFWDLEKGRKHGTSKGAPPPSRPGTELDRDTPSTPYRRESTVDLSEIAPQNSCSWAKIGLQIPFFLILASVGRGPTLKFSPIFINFRQFCQFSTAFSAKAPEIKYEKWIWRQ